MTDLADLDCVAEVLEIAGGRIFEIIRASDEQGFGLAIAEERSSLAHYHKFTTETYVVLEGFAEIELHGKVIHSLGVLDALKIPPTTLHRIVQTAPGTKILVPTSPAYDPKDVYYN